MLFKDVSEYVQVCMDPAQARQLVDRACRIALDHRGVCTIIFPNDVAELKAVESPPRAHGSVYSSVGYTPPARAAAESPTSSTRPRSSTTARRSRCWSARAPAAPQRSWSEVAELLGAGVAKALLGKDVLPDDLPYVTGAIGLLGTTPSYEMMEGCDTLLMVGTSFPYSEFLPKEGQARCVEIDIDGGHDRHPLPGRRAARRRREGDAEGARAAPRAQGGPRLARADRGEGRATGGTSSSERAMMAADPMNPQRVGGSSRRCCPRTRSSRADSGSSTNWFARQLKLAQGQPRLALRDARDDGPGVPYAIAAKFAHPRRPVICFVGDGAFQMLGMNEMLTVKRYMERGTTSG